MKPLTLVVEYLISIVQYFNAMVQGDIVAAGAHAAKAMMIMANFFDSGLDEPRPNEGQNSIDDSKSGGHDKLS